MAEGESQPSLPVTASEPWPEPSFYSKLSTGLKMLRDAGHHTIAQDRGTSAVFGMPKAAAELGAAAEVLPLERIAGAIARRIRSNGHTC